jgi:hypothetical protein
LLHLFNLYQHQNPPFSVVPFFGTTHQILL